MSEPFDPYHRWLGIPPEDQPPNHYRLLGIAPFEDQPDVIEHAADRQMAHLRTFQVGPHAVISQRLLNEVAAAKLCLLRPEKKAAYDEFLRGRPASSGGAAGPTGTPPPFPAAPPEDEPPVVELDVPSEGSDSSPAGAASRRRRWLAAGAGVLAVGLVLGIVALAVMLAFPPSPPFPADLPPDLSDAGETLLALNWPEDRRLGATLELNGVRCPVPLTGPVEYPCQPGEIRIVAIAPGFGRVEETVRAAAWQRNVVELRGWSSSPPAAEEEISADELAIWESLFEAEPDNAGNVAVGSPKPQSPEKTAPGPATATPMPAETKTANPSGESPTAANPATEPPTSPMHPALPAPEPPPKRPELKPEPFKTVAQLDPVLAEAWALIRRGEHVKGRDTLVQASKLNREDLRVAFSLGLVDALVTLDWNAAEKEFLQCVQEHPRHIASLNNLALVRLRLNREPQSMKHFQTALAEGPPPAEIVQNLGRIRYLLQKERLSFKPVTQKAVDNLFTDAQRAGNTRFDQGLGFQYIGLYGGGDPDFGWSDPNDYEDCWCVVCNARGKMKCPAHDCVHGTVTRMSSKVVGFNAMTKAPIYQSAPIRVPCPTCRASGWVTCGYCREGKDRQLRRSQSSIPASTQDRPAK
jgi:tetratricopeptide (TPR) repeat protein